MDKVLVTGAAGFIGYHLTKALLLRGNFVIGVDNLNDYYDPNLKKARLDDLSSFTALHGATKRFVFSKLDIAHKKDVEALFKKYDFDIVINLAAQAGVRYSLEDPAAYIDSNLLGFSNIIECCKRYKIGHLLFASSSSVYGMNIKQPFSEIDNTDYPVSLYAATKKANELLAHSYSHLFNLPCSGLRFFTVYGPYGRPDMAYYSFTKAILEGKSIDVFNNGNLKRDFTYIDDIVAGILKIVAEPPSLTSTFSSAATAPFEIYNIGNNEPVTLNRFIETIENCLSKKAIKNMKPMQDGDVPLTYADISKLSNKFGYQPLTSIEEGMKKFTDWYLSDIA
tara:strand:+ start:6037 stop:7047 length:1011 start_codon:yes stop_codon:yes gene_type:complete